MTVSGILDDTHLQNDVDRSFFFPVGQTPAVDGVLPVRKGSKTWLKKWPPLSLFIAWGSLLLIHKLLVYRKATNTDQYLNFSSHHSIHHKLGVIRTLLDRIHSVVTEDEDKEEEEKIKLVLSRCGYLSWFFKQVKDKMVNKQKQVISKKKDNNNRTKCLVVIPYVEEPSQKAKGIFKKHGVATAIRPDTTLRKLLVHPKDKRDLLSTTDCIYEIPRKNVSTPIYVRPADALVLALVNIKKKPSVWKVVNKTTLVLLENSCRVNYQNLPLQITRCDTTMLLIDWDNAKILGKECITSIERIRESMWTRRRGPQAMNRDEGEHFLSHVFDPFLTGSTPSTAGVRPTGKKKDRSKSFWRLISSKIPETVNPWGFFFCFCFVLMNFHFIHIYKPDESIQGCFSIFHSLCRFFSFNAYW